MENLLYLYGRPHIGIHGDMELPLTFCERRRVSSENLERDKHIVCVCADDNVGQDPYVLV